MSKIPALPIAALLFLSAARGQSMDYGGVERLFGEPATMSATGAPQRAADVPANMIIISQDDIRTSGARDIPSVLRHVGGLDVLQWANDNYDVSARGYNQAYSGRTLVLIDGRQVYVDAFGFTPWSALPVELSEIQQIEVVKGPNAALFGFNAVAGIINIITDNPRYNDTTTTSLRYGSQGLFDSSATMRFHLGQDAFLRLSGGYRADKAFGSPNPLPVDGAPQLRNNRLSVNADAIFVLAENVELGVAASHSQAKQNEVSSGYKLQTSNYGTNSISGRLSADTEWGLLRLSAYNNWFSWVQTVGHGNVAPKLMNTVTVVQADDLFNIAPDHTIRLAAEYRHNEVTPRDRADGVVEFSAGSASLMWNWQIAPALSWTSALRYDSVFYDSSFAAGSFGATMLKGPPYDINQWSYNAGLVWTATPNDTLRLLTSRGVQLPSLVQFWDAAHSQAVLSSQDLQLKPSTVVNFEALWNRQFPQWNARMQIAVFHQRTFDVISTGGGSVAASGPAGIAPANVGSSQATGLEVEGSGVIAGNWTWSASYRFESINDDYIRAGNARTDLVSYGKTTPEHVVKVGLGWNSGPWEINAYMHYQSASAGLRQTDSRRLLVSVHPFTSFDARLAYRLTDYATLSLSGQNLINAMQQQTSGPDVERQFFLTLDIKA